MSDAAVKAFYRLMPKPRVDGTALYVLYHLAWRYNDRTEAAYPSIAGMVRELKLAKQTLLDAIRRLEAARLISVARSSTRGRGKTNHYRFPWLSAHLLNPKSTDPIEWRTDKWSGPPDHLETKIVRSTGVNGTAHRSTKVRCTVPENNKTLKTSKTPRVLDAASVRETVEKIFGSRAHLGPADQVMFDKEMKRHAGGQL